MSLALIQRRMLSEKKIKGYLRRRGYILVLSVVRQSEFYCIGGLPAVCVADLPLAPLNKMELRAMNMAKICDSRLYAPYRIFPLVYLYRARQEK
jgi:hypothetical protein